MNLSGARIAWLLGTLAASAGCCRPCAPRRGDPRTIVCPSAPAPAVVPTPRAAPVTPVVEIAADAVLIESTFLRVPDAKVGSVLSFGDYVPAAGVGRLVASEAAGLEERVRRDSGLRVLAAPSVVTAWGEGAAVLVADESARDRALERIPPAAPGVWLRIRVVREPDPAVLRVAVEAAHRDAATAKDPRATGTRIAGEETIDLRSPAGTPTILATAPLDPKDPHAPGRLVVHIRVTPVSAKAPR